MALRIEKMALRYGAFSLTGDIEIPAGGVTALLGPSGAGKSSVLNAIAGFADLQSGRISWDGTSIEALPPGQRPVATLFQDNNLFPHLSVLRNVALALSRRARPLAGDLAQAEAALARVGLAGYGARMPGTLSGGQQSRVALARVLLQDKPLVLLDEPFSALGPGQRAEMMALVREVLIGAGRTVLFVTHDAEDAARADAICVVADGRVASPVEAASLLADPPEVIRIYLGK